MNRGSTPCLPATAGVVRARSPRMNLRQLDRKYVGRESEALLVTTSGKAITMFPPLTLDRRTAKAGLDILEKSLR